MSLTLVYFGLLIIVMVGVMESQQTINSLLWLITLFISGALFFIYIGADIIGLLLIIVYVGAVGVFFLFMIMLLNQKVNAPNRIYFWDAVVFSSLTAWYIPDQLFVIWDAIWNLDNWLERSFIVTDLGSIATGLFDWYGWPTVLLSFLLFKAMLIAIDIGRSKS